MNCCSKLEVDRDGTDLSPTAMDLQEQRIRHASRHLDNGALQTEFIVPDMHCAGCIGTIERSLSSLSQVRSVRANLSNRSVAVLWDPQIGAGSEIAEMLERKGFGARLFVEGSATAKTADETGRQLLTSMAVAGFAAANIMLLSVSVWAGADEATTQLFHLISGLIAVPAVAYAGRPFFASAGRALSARRLNMDVPISLAVLLALAMSLYESIAGGSEAYFDAAVTLLFFLLIGRYLDHLMRQRARGAVDRLAQMTARGGVLVEQGQELRYIALDEIRQGMRLRIMPGERLPVDGQVIEGSSDIDRSLVTGESNSDSCNPGDRLEAGTLNLTGTIDIRATGDASNSFLAEVSAMMQAAEQGRSRYVGIADRMARLYAPAVHLLALVTFVGWMAYTGGDWHTSIYTAIAVLIITCPCALGLAVPVVHVVGAHQLMRRGIMMRDGTAFERLASIDTVVFDKTGTLTRGEPVVMNDPAVQSHQHGLIKALAIRSSHPASRAVADHFSSATPNHIAETREVPGFGIEARLNGKLVRLGHPAWAGEIALLDENQEDQGGVAFARQGQQPIIFRLEDRLRDHAAATIKALVGRGLRVEILSGDHAAQVAAVADQLGVGSYRSRMNPAQKITHIKKLKSNGHRVLMVGDGINDGPALAAGNVSMAPASASDVGRLASDFVFTRASLMAVATARDIALSTNRLVRQNFALAIIYNCVAVPLAMAGYITPLIAAIAMSSSSVAVIANSLRLNLLHPLREMSVDLDQRSPQVPRQHAAGEPANPTSEVAA